MSTQVRIKGIMSYPHLFEPRAVKQGDAPKYSVNILVHKQDPQLRELFAAIETEKANGFPQGFPANGKICVKDNAEYPEYYEIRSNTNADNAPYVVELPSLQPVMDRSKVYAGAEAYFALSISSYNDQFNKGVGAYINGVCITGQQGALGRIDNRPTAEQMFAGIGGAPVPTAGAPVPTPGMPSPPPAPVAQHVMTPAAQGVTYEAYRQAGWTDDQLIQNGLMLPPGGVPTRF